MAINLNLLVTAPIFQYAILDDVTGQPLINGTINLWTDSSRTTRKNWYQQVGSGPYTYITLPNPLTLSAAGSVNDGSGNDVLPFFYPFSEIDNTTSQPYYIEVYDSGGHLKFTRENFPFVPIEQNISQGSLINNLVINKEFWRNGGVIDGTTLPLNPLTGQYAISVCPSQHDGFSMPDIQYVKDANGAVDTISFLKFPLNSDDFSPNFTPEFYCNFQCTGAGTEGVKVIQIPISLHLQNLQGLPFIFNFWAKNEGGPNNIEISLLSYLGSDQSLPSSDILQTILLTNSWASYTIVSNFPTPVGAIGSTYDDAFYLQLSFPPATTCNISFAIPSVYLGTVFPEINYSNYDNINAVISSPRTSDIRITSNSYASGYVPLNDGTIGSQSSIATTRANSDAFQLYNSLWNIAKPYDSGSNFNPICQMYDSTSTPINFGSTSVSDFTSENVLRLTLTMGKVLMGTVPPPNLVSYYFDTYTASNSGGSLLITTSSPKVVFNGMPIAFNQVTTLPSGIFSNIIYYVSGFNGTNAFFISNSFNNAITASHIAYSAGDGGSNTVQGALLGSYTGEFAHTQLVPELASHGHISDYDAIGSVGSAQVIAANQGISATKKLSGQIEPAGSSVAFNIVQPSTFYNMFMKL